MLSLQCSTPGTCTPGPATRNSNFSRLISIAPKPFKLSSIGGTCISSRLSNHYKTYKFAPRIVPRYHTSFARSPPRCTSTVCSATQQSRNIAIAIDTSPDAHYACQWTLDNIVRPGDTVHLLHCLPTLPRQGLYTLPDGRLVVVDYNKLMASEDEYFKSAQRVIAQMVFDVFNVSKVRYVIHLIKEDPYVSGDKGIIARDICDKAEELNAAALIISSHTRSQLSELLIGSVANFATHNCTQPVLVLHAPNTTTGAVTTTTAPTNKLSSNSIARWLGDLLNLGTHPETKGTAADEVATKAASGVVASSHRPDTRGVVTSSDLPSDSSNLVGQAIGGLDTTLGSSSDEGSLVSSGDVSNSDDNVIGQVVGLEDDLTTTHPLVDNSNDDVAVVEPSGTKQQGSRRIVVAVDDTDCSERACQFAVQELYKPGDDIHIVHIVPSMPRIAYSASPNFGGGESFALVLDPPTEDTKPEIESLLQKRFTPLLQGVIFTSDVLLEPTEDSVAGVGRAICRRAADLDADILVLGSHMRGGLQEFLLGSVAQWVSHHCTSAVAVLH